MCVCVCVCVCENKMGQGKNHRSIRKFQKLRLQTHTQNMYYLRLFHRCSVTLICTMPLFLITV